MKYILKIYLKTIITLLNTNSKSGDFLSRHIIHIYIYIYIALINFKKMRNLILVEINYYKLLNLFLYN
jgi:hypothetical protein